MPDTISQSLRELVRQRANYCCEYCLLPESVALHKHEPDHIIPRQHGGKTEADNLALACMRCNRHKGPNVGSFDEQSGDLTPFFHPRWQDWSAHFCLRGAEIQALSASARVTLKILRINDPKRIEERQALIEAGLYPP